MTNHRTSKVVRTMPENINADIREVDDLLHRLIVPDHLEDLTGASINDRLETIDDAIDALQRLRDRLETDF